MMVVQAGAAARVLDGDHAQVRDSLDVIAATGRQTVDEMRTFLGVLRTEDGHQGRTPQPGLADLDRLTASVREAGSPVTVRIEGQPCVPPRTLDLSAFRIVQEGLTNALKHAGPAEAQVVVRYTDASVELEIVDNGSPLPGGRSYSQGQGHGLVGMRERATMFGGELEAAHRLDGRGFRVHARLPRNPSTWA
jgi:signal transduction histidine kinase